MNALCHQDIVIGVVDGVVRDSPAHPDRDAVHFALRGQATERLPYVAGWGDPVRLRNRALVSIRRTLTDHADSQTHA